MRETTQSLELPYNVNVGSPDCKLRESMIGSVLCPIKCFCYSYCYIILFISMYRKQYFRIHEK